MCLFKTDVRNPCREYQYIRDSLSPRLIRTKEVIEQLWKEYKPFADPDFEQRIAEDFSARFWEMYLTVSLFRAGCAINQRKSSHGPDIAIDYNGKRIWIEAVTPSSGDPSLKDSVPELKPSKTPKSFAVPDDAMILRIRSSIRDKHLKWIDYKNNGTVLCDQPYLIAINTCKIPLSILEQNVPRIVRSVFPIGHEQITIDSTTLQTLAAGHQYRPEIKKSSGEAVSTSIFLEQEYKNISAILFSSVGVVDAIDAFQQGNMLKKCIVVHNPLAINRIEIIKPIDNFIAKTESNGWTVHKIKAEGILA